jgi:hypothetical protein
VEDHLNPRSRLRFSCRASDGEGVTYKLRITVEENGSLTEFQLEGKLKGEWVRELERCSIYAGNADWRSAHQAQGGRA